MNSFILEKRTEESVFYNIDCSMMLSDEEIITEILSISSDQDGLIFSATAINPDPIIFPGPCGGPALPGKVISVQISAGIIPDPQNNQLYTIRALFVTTDNNTLEAVVLLNVTDLPLQNGRMI